MILPAKIYQICMQMQSAAAAAAAAAASKSLLSATTEYAIGEGREVISPRGRREQTRQAVSQLTGLLGVYVEISVRL